MRKQVASHEQLEHPNEPDPEPLPERRHHTLEEFRNAGRGELGEEAEEEDDDIRGLAEGEEEDGARGSGHVGPADIPAQLRLRRKGCISGQVGGGSRVATVVGGRERGRGRGGMFVLVRVPEAFNIVDEEEELGRDAEDDGDDREDADDGDGEEGEGASVQKAGEEEHVGGGK